MTKQDTPEDAVNWLLAQVRKKTSDLATKLRHDPRAFLRGNTPTPAAFSRQVCGMAPRPTDSDVLAKLADDLVAHIVEQRVPSNGAFQKGYAELIYRVHVAPQVGPAGRQTARRVR